MDDCADEGGDGGDDKQKSRDHVHFVSKFLPETTSQRV